MSRAAMNKSRTEKGGRPPPSQTPVVSHEIVPGKFNDQDWNRMLEKDGSEEFVEDIVDDLITTTLDKCYELYIERQLVPFTVTQAKDAILSIIEWQFLGRDEGEESPESDTGWIQDEEPDPAETDCWAQGSVPRTYIPSPAPEPIIEEPEEEEIIQEEQDERKDEQSAEKQEIEEDVELADQVSVDEDAGKEEAERLAKEEAEKAKAEELKKKKRFKPYTGRMKSPGLKVTESLEQTEMTLLTQEIMASMPPPEKIIGGLVTMPASCHSILKVQAGRPPGNKDVEYDDYGNVVAILRLNPERLPNHRIKVNYQVVDPAVEAAQARLDAMKTGRYVAPKLKKKTTKTDSKEEQKLVEVTRKTPIKTALPPPMIETMDISPGVTVKEGGRVKQGPSRYVRRMDLLSQTQRGLKPVNSQAITPRLDVTDILDRHTPILRPIHDNQPLPPIMAIPHPPEKPRITT